LEEVSRELENPDVWNDSANAQSLGRERALLDGIVGTLGRVSESLAENVEMLEMAIEEQDEEILESVVAEVDGIEVEVGKLEFQRMFRGEVDANPCYLEIQSGSGGTEAQDWAEMLLRMYLRWVERRGWKGELIEVSAGEVAGIKSATIHITGDYAYGWCKTEIGVHRLVYPHQYRGAVPERPFTAQK